MRKAHSERPCFGYCLRKNTAHGFSPEFSHGVRISQSSLQEEKPQTDLFPFKALPVCVFFLRSHTHCSLLQSAVTPGCLRLGSLGQSGSPDKSQAKLLQKHSRQSADITPPLSRCGHKGHETPISQQLHLTFFCIAHRTGFVQSWKTWKSRGIL